MKYKIRNLLYIAAVLAICAVPSAGMFLTGPTEKSYENRTLAGWPSFTEEGSPNVRYLEQAGEWFTDHFALKNEMVTANSLVRAKLFGVSSSDRVIVGREGWLFYASSLHDHLGTDLMSARALWNLAHTMGMVSRSLEQDNVSFLFAVAPNKNTIYPAFMPWYDSHAAAD